MSHVRLVGLSVLLGAFTPGLSAKPKCTNVRGSLVFHSTGPASFESVLTGDLEGPLVGTNFQILKVGDDGTLFGVVDHEFITSRGTLYTVAEDVLSPTGPNLYQTSERNFFLPGGTGDFEGAAGTLLIQGSADFNIGQGS